MADKVFHTNASGMGNELRDWSVEKLAATPSALYAGRFWQNTTDNSLYYSPDGAVVVRLSTLNDVETRTRFVGVLNLATGSIPLITPIADINAETSWDAGDFGCVGVGGTLAPIPGFGNETAAVGDLVICIQNNPTGNSAFMIVERNQAATTVSYSALVDLVAGINVIPHTLGAVPTNFQITHPDLGNVFVREISRTNSNITVEAAVVLLGNTITIA